MPYRIFAEGCRLSLWNPLTSSLLYITPRYCCQLRHIIYHAGHSTINGEEEGTEHNRRRPWKCRTPAGTAGRNSTGRSEGESFILRGVSKLKAEASLLLGSVNNAHVLTFQLAREINGAALTNWLKISCWIWLICRQMKTAFHKLLIFQLRLDFFRLSTVIRKCLILVTTWLPRPDTLLKCHGWLLPSSGLVHLCSYIYRLLP